MFNKDLAKKFVVANLISVQLCKHMLIWLFLQSITWYVTKVTRYLGLDDKT